MKIIKLSELKIGSVASLVEMKNEEEVTSRLSAMGISLNTKLKMLNLTKIGGNVLIEVINNNSSTRIMLNKSEADMISVSLFD